MLDQSEKARDWYVKRGEGERIPIGIYHVVGSPLDDAYLFLRLCDFERYFDPLLKAYELMEELRAETGLQLLGTAEEEAEAS